MKPVALIKNFFNLYGVRLSFLECLSSLKVLIFKISYKRLMEGFAGNLPAKMDCRQKSVNDILNNL